MSSLLHVTVVGDYDPNSVPHRATNEALAHSGRALGVQVAVAWTPTASLDTDLGMIKLADAIWCAPGSPYESLTGVLRALRYGRELGVPTLGTCGGCQHMVIEFARNVLRVDDAQHAEYDPYASRLFITPLSCSLAGQTLPVTLRAGSKAAEIYGLERIEEEYYCNFGLNPAYAGAFDEAGFAIAGADDDREARVLELSGHPFYLGTLYVPQTRSTAARPHPVVNALLQSALDRAARSHATVVTA